MLTISAVSAAIPAPQPNANARLARGSGSSRSIHSTTTTSSGTGNSASGSAIANGAAPLPAANDCTASMPSATIAHAAVTAMPTMKATGVRPAGRPARPALGLNGSLAAGGGPDSLTVSSLLRRCRLTARTCSRIGLDRDIFGLDQVSGEPCANGLPRAVCRLPAGIGSERGMVGHRGLPSRVPPRARELFPPPRRTPEKPAEGIRDVKVSNHALDWTPADKRAVDHVRALAMDAVQKSATATPARR